MAKFQKGKMAAVKQLSKTLTKGDIAKIQLLLAVPGRIIEATQVSDEPGIELMYQLKNWEEFNPVVFMQTIEEMNNRELLSLAKKIPWINASVPRQVATEKKTAHTFINLLRDVGANDWKIISLELTGSNNTEEILNCCIKEGIIKKDLTVLCDVMRDIERDDLIPKIQNYASVFEGLSEKEFKTKLLSEIEYEEEDNHSEWMRKLREYMLLQNRDVSVILDREMVALESVYTPLTVIKQETDRVRPEEETSIREIEFLRKIKIYNPEPKQITNLGELQSKETKYTKNEFIIDFETKNTTTDIMESTKSKKPRLEELKSLKRKSDATTANEMTIVKKPRIGSASIMYQPINWGSKREKYGCEGKSGTVNFETHLSHCRTPDPEVWTLVGNPGCGKTFLCKYAGYNYGIDNIENFNYLLSIPCRDTEWHAIEVARQEDNEIKKYIRRWLGISMPLGVGWAESLTRYLMRTGGESLLLIIDGLDEFIKTVPFNTTLLYLLLQKRILPSATILLTSRPGAWSNIYTQFKDHITINRHYQVLGFSPENRDKYFQKRVISESKLEDTHKLFQRHEEISLLALVPVNASLFSSLFNDTEDILSQTVTDVYQALITYMVRRQLSRMGLKVYTKVSHLSNFAPDIKACISVIGQEAYKGIYDRELVCKDDVILCLREKEYTCERLGLMQEHFVVLKLFGRIKVWVYAHLTLQEFMSAVWLSYQKWTQQCLIIRFLVSSDELFFMFKMVVRFVCGILCDRAGAMLSILCKKLIPYTTQQIPMYYQLGYNDNLRMLHLCNWVEFMRCFFELIYIILESKSGATLMKNILPEPLHCYFVSAVSPNDWYTFLLSLPFLPHIQIIFIDVSYISTELFHSLLSRIDQCSLNYLALRFDYQESSTILFYTSLISSDMPAHIKISIQLDKCRGIKDFAILFPPSFKRFTGSLGIHETKLSKKCINDLISKFTSIQYIYYYPENRPDWSVHSLITKYEPSHGLFLMDRPGKSFYISPDIFSHLSSLQEIHLQTEDAYSVLPHLHSFHNLTYLALQPTYFSPDRVSYGDILKQLINRNSNTLRGIKLHYFHRIGFNSWNSILALIQDCNKLIELEIRGIRSPVNEDILSRNTTVDYLQSLIRLHLSCILLSSSEVYTLCDGLAYSPGIKEIRISDCKLDSTHCIHFIHLIPTLPRLMELDVSYNELSSPDPTQVEILEQTAEEYSVKLNT